MSESISKGFDIKDKTVLITGANRGIGRALVDGFLTYGARKVYAAVRDLSSVEPLIEKYGEDMVIPLYIDLQKPTSIEEAAKTFSDVQVVVNNAGVLEMTGPLSDDAISVLQYQMEVNVYGLMYMARYFVPILETNGGGCFIQINSVSSLRCPQSRFFAYSASKHASFAYIQGLRSSLKKTLVISVHPGPIATDMVDQFGGRDRSEPASIVANALVHAMREGDFLVFPDSKSKETEDFYKSFATSVVEPCSRYTHSR